MNLEKMRLELLARQPPIELESMKGELQECGYSSEEIDLYTVEELRKEFERLKACQMRHGALPPQSTGKG